MTYSAIEINGEPVNHGDIVFIGLESGRLPLIYVAVKAPETGKLGLWPCEMAALSFFLSDAEWEALRNVKGRATAAGKRELIWHREEWAKRSVGGVQVQEIKPLDISDAIMTGIEDGGPPYPVDASLMIHAGKTVNLKRAAQRLAEILNKRQRPAAAPSVTADMLHSAFAAIGARSILTTNDYERVAGVINAHLQNALIR